MRSSLSILLMSAPLLLGAVVYGGVTIEDWNARTEGNAILVTWTARVEDGVREYDLLRMTPYSEEFKSVAVMRAHGSGKVYSFRDDQVYKNASDMIDYRLDVIYTDGSRQTVKIAKVNYTSTAVRRTWGSIKAMFQ